MCVLVAKNNLIVHVIVLNYLRTYNRLSENQFRFLPNKNTDQAVAIYAALRDI